MSVDVTDLSPWAHPKAQAWFRALFRRSSFGLALENELTLPDEQLSLSQLRAMLAFGVMLGRPGIWPKQDRDILKKLLKRVRERASAPPSSFSGKPLSVAEHQAHQRNVEALQQEIELLRRWLGSSMRTSPMATPDTWGRFWE